MLQLGVVLTEGGMVEGKNHIMLPFVRYMDVFKGIPFAAQPGRFEKPVPHPGWSGAYTHLSYFYTVSTASASLEFAVHGFTVAL